ncbi:MAG TPA: hypothetical protein DEA43_03295 [Candidatus Moranbacteria bacterium]|nr:hypothetical protein [Candidatus Moranbacteria bacterium]HBT45880.1 hypothetical protein [Candidatus Moranbacteria bacterium]
MGSNHEILLGLTTTPKSDWLGKVEEMKKFGIKKIALFPTFLKINDRKELYRLLEDIEGLEIPHVHLRHQDMEFWEVELFKNKYKTQYFNIHPNIKLNARLEQYAGEIYVENMFCEFEVENLKRFAGICLDTEHLNRVEKIAPKTHAQTIELLNTLKIGCCHISPKRKLKNIIKRVFLNAWRHYFLSLDEFDYIGQYRQYLPYYISLELENSFEEQLETKKYLENILSI